MHVGGRDPRHLLAELCAQVPLAPRQAHVPISSEPGWLAASACAKPASTPGEPDLGIWTTKCYPPITTDAHLSRCCVAPPSPGQT